MEVLTYELLDKSIRPLKQEALSDAKQIARESLIQDRGGKPQIDTYLLKAQTIQKYPLWMVRLVTGLCLLVLVAVFIPSAMRIFAISAETFSHSIDHPVATSITGVALVLMSEVGLVVCSLAFVVLQLNRFEKAALLLAMLITSIVALVGNIEFAQPWQLNSPFAWLEAVVPTLAVWILSLILKKQMMGAVKQRHEANMAYTHDLEKWELSKTSPEEDPDWEQYYATALRDALYQANYRRKDFQAIKDQLTVDHWRWLVRREINAENWYAAPQVQPVQQTIATGTEQNPQLIPVPHTNGNGHQPDPNLNGGGA